MGAMGRHGIDLACRVNHEMLLFYLDFNIVMTLAYWFLLLNFRRI